MEKLAAQWLTHGSPAEAAQIYQWLQLAEPKVARWVYLEAESLLDAGQAIQAAQQLEPKLQQFPGEASLHWKLGEALLRSGEFPTALESCQVWRGKFPDRMEFVELERQALLKLGQRTEAERRKSLLMSSGGTESPLPKDLLTLDAFGPPGWPVDTQQRFGLEADPFPAFRDEYRHSVEELSPTPLVKVRWAREAATAGNLHRAVELIDQAAADSRLGELLRWERLLYLGWTGDERLIRSALKEIEVLPGGRNRAVSQIALGAGLMRAGQVPQGCAQVEQGFAESQGQIPAYRLRGMCAETSGKLRQAIPHYSAGLKATPGDREAGAGLLRVYQRLGLRQKAEEYQEYSCARPAR